MILKCFLIKFLVILGVFFSFRLIRGSNYAQVYTVIGAEAFSIKLRPAHHLSVWMWQSNQFEFETPALFIDKASF
jgi:hypothetical protein